MAEQITGYVTVYQRKKVRNPAFSAFIREELDRREAEARYWFLRWCAADAELKKLKALTA